MPSQAATPARPERARVLFRIDELQQTLRHTQSDDVREAIQQALATCWKRLAALDARIGTGVRSSIATAGEAVRCAIRVRRPVGKSKPTKHRGNPSSRLGRLARHPIPSAASDTSAMPVASCESLPRAHPASRAVPMPAGDRSRNVTAMPDRLDTITVALSRGDVTISWDARQALLARLQHVNESSSLRAMFEAVGATRPVELNPAQRATLLGLLDEWTLDRRCAMPADAHRTSGRAQRRPRRPRVASRTRACASGRAVGRKLRCRRSANAGQPLASSSEPRRRDSTQTGIVSTIHDGERTRRRAPSRAARLKTSAFTGVTMPRDLVPGSSPICAIAWAASPACRCRS